MKVNDIVNVQYQLPKDIKRGADKYRWALHNGICKYLSLVYLCGGYILYDQFTALVTTIEGRNNKSYKANYMYGLRLIKKMEENGFIKSQTLGRYKYFYLLYPAMRIVDTNIKHVSHFHSIKDMSQSRFEISLLKAQYAIEYGYVISGAEDMLLQLKHVTLTILDAIKARYDNPYQCFDIVFINRLLNCSSISEALKILDGHPETSHRLDYIRVLWKSLGIIYNKMTKQRFSVFAEPDLLRVFIEPYGRYQIRLSMVTNFIVFDVNHDINYYKSLISELTAAFNTDIEGNELLEAAKIYNESNGTSLGDERLSHIGFTLTIIGNKESSLNIKVQNINYYASYKYLNDSNITPVSAFMGEAVAIPMDIYKYFAYNARTTNNPTRDKILKSIDTKISDIIEPNCNMSVKPDNMIDIFMNNFKARYEHCIDKNGNIISDDEGLYKTDIIRKVFSNNSYPIMDAVAQYRNESIDEINDLYFYIMVALEGRKALLRNIIANTIKL